MQVQFQQLRTSQSHTQWAADHVSLPENLLLKDFRIRWLLPIFCSFTIIPARYQDAYPLNPPAAPLLISLTLSSVTMFLIGFLVFRLLGKGLYDHL
jgi:hypothetical protein